MSSEPPKKKGPPPAITYAYPAGMWSQSRGGPYVMPTYMNAATAASAAAVRATQPGGPRGAERGGRGRRRPTNLTRPLTVGPHAASLSAAQAPAIVPRTSLRTKGEPPLIVAAAAAAASLPLRSREKSPMGINALLQLAFTSVMSQESLRNKWLPAAGIVDILKKRYKFPENIHESQLHKAVTKLTEGCVDIQDATNQTGIFRIKRDLGKDRTQPGKRFITWFYYVTDPGKPMGPLIPRPAMYGDKVKAINKNEPSSGRKVRAAKTTATTTSEPEKKASSKDRKQEAFKEGKRAREKEEWLQFYKDAQEACDQEVERRNSKRQRVKDAVDEELERILRLQKDKEMERKALEQAKEAKANQLKKVASLNLTCFFDSTEAKSMFRPKEGESVQECLKRRIDLFSSAINDPDGYSKLVAPADEDEPEPTLALRQKMLQKAMCLRLSYVNALEMMGTGTSFTQCIGKAMEELKHATSIEYAYANTATIQKLNRDFRENEMFPPFNKRKKSRKSKTPSKEPVSVAMHLEMDD